MVRKYKKEKDNPRATINLGKKGEPFRDLFDKISKKYGSATEFFRDAVLTMHSDDIGYKQRKIAFLKQQILKVHHDALILADERRRLEEALIKAGATDAEMDLLYG